MEACRKAEEAFMGDPLSASADGADLRAHLARCAADTASFFGAAACHFFPEGTSAGLILHQLCQGHEAGKERHVVAAATECVSMMEALRDLQRQGAEVELCPVERDGMVDPDRFTSMLRSGSSLACVSWASRASGIVQPLQELARGCEEMDVPLVAEGSLVAGRLEIDISKMHLPALVVRSRAMGAPGGLDALLLSSPLEVLDPLMASYSPGPGIPAGIRAAVEELSTGVAARSRIVSELRDALVQRLTEKLEGCLPLVEQRHLVPGAFLLLLRRKMQPGLHARLEIAGLRVAESDGAQRLAFLDSIGMDREEADRLVGGCLYPGSSMVDVELFCRVFQRVVENG